MDVKYAVEENLSLDEFIEVLRKSGLAERRPVQNKARIKQMLKNANLIVTARYNGKLIGVARSLSDFAYCTYLSDLAVSMEYQKKGVGKELIRITKSSTAEAKLILLSAPAAVTYYPRIGMKKHNNCFILDDVGELI
jgi:ribosomal protein S18 acetylase RimI-like enzyme